MLEFNFNYKEHEIKYTVDFLGREKCLVDTELVFKSSTPWLSSRIDFTFNVGAEELRIYRRILSYKEAEYQLKLANKDKVIEQQSKEFYNSDIGPVNESVFYKNEERAWTEEIKLPQSLFNTAFVLYFIAILADFMEYFTNIERAVDITLISIIIVVSFAIVTLLKTVTTSFKVKVKRPDNNDEAAI